MDLTQSKIAVKGSYGFGNFGDDALMAAVDRIVRGRFGTDSIYYLCPEYSMRGYIQKILPGARRIENGQKFDLVIYGGGTQFYSFPPTLFRRVAYFRKLLNYARDPARLARLIRQMVSKVQVSESGAIVAALGIGIGPFVENSPEIQETRDAINRMNYVAVRDMDSYETCRGWGCANTEFRSDLCYYPGLWDARPPSLENKGGKVRKIGIIPRDWPHTREGDAYAAPLFQVVRQLRGAGKTVDFISFAKKSDHVWAGRLKNETHTIAWDPERDSIEQFLRTLAQYDVLITARYHGAVFASLLGKPVVCIGIEPKLDLVAGMLGRGARLWSYPFSPRECLDHLESMENSCPECVANLESAVAEQGALAKKMIEELLAFVIESASGVK